MNIAGDLQLDASDSVYLHLTASLTGNKVMTDGIAEADNDGEPRSRIEYDAKPRGKSLYLLRLLIVTQM